MPKIVIENEMFLILLVIVLVMAVIGYIADKERNQKKQAEKPTKKEKQAKQEMKAEKKEEKEEVVETSLEMPKEETLEESQEPVFTESTPVPMTEETTVSTEETSPVEPTVEVTPSEETTPAAEVVFEEQRPLGETVPTIEEATPFQGETSEPTNLYNGVDIAEVAEKIISEQEVPETITATGEDLTVPLEGANPASENTYTSEELPKMEEPMSSVNLSNDDLGMTDLSSFQLHTEAPTSHDDELRF